MAKLQQLISFKQSEKYIYDEIQKHSGKGNWVKDILDKYIKDKENLDKILELSKNRRD